MSPRKRDLYLGLAVLVLGALIYLPRLGTYPLWDPWEPHYSQVAWEMSQHDTWLNPWYRNQDNWWSKPILMLWLLRGSFALFWDSASHFANNEWAARLPFALVAIFGAWIQFDWVRRLYGHKVALLASVVLLTAPQYLLIGRQAMADMVFLVPYTAAMGYLAVGLFTRPTPRYVTGAAWRYQARDFWRGEWPFVIFWAAQGVAVLAKGFVPPALAVLVLAGYHAGTFRWSDYAAPTRRWSRYILTRGALAALSIAAGIGVALLVRRLGGPKEKILLYQVLAFTPFLLAATLGAFRDLPPMRHAWHLLGRIRVGYGLVVFFAVCAPWYVYMSLEHGWPYWNEFIFYHHLGRAAGTIDKPSHPFDYYVRQLGFALFPWSAALVGAGYRFIARSSPTRSVAERRNFYVLLAALLPYLFFMLSGTKFAHYIFPVVPFAGLMAAAVLVWLGRDDDDPVALVETTPALGAPVPAHVVRPSSWWEAPGQKGELVAVVAVTLVAFGILAHDLVLDYRYFLRLFIYYANRATPIDYQPFVLLQILFVPAGVGFGLPLLARYMKRWHLGLVAASAIVTACYIGWVMMPAMGATYSYEPVWAAYESMARQGEPVGQFNDWQQPERSVIFLSQNKCEHLKNEKLATSFIARPGRKFVIVDRDRLNDLRKIAKAQGTKLFVVFDGHPYARLVSNEPSQNGPQKPYLVDELPGDANAADANFDDKMKLVGWKVSPATIVPGEAVEVSMFYKALGPIERDWQIFVHGDGPRGAQNRLHGDHYPAEGLYPTNEWQEGDLVRDTFKLDVPADYPYDMFTVWTGFYIDDSRMRVSGGTSDGDNRVRGPLVRVKR